MWIIWSFENCSPFLFIIRHYFTSQLNFCFTSEDVNIVYIFNRLDKKFFGINLGQTHKNNSCQQMNINFIAKQGYYVVEQCILIQFQIKL